MGLGYDVRVMKIDAGIKELMGWTRDPALKRSQGKLVRTASHSFQHTLQSEKTQNLILRKHMQCQATRSGEASSENVTAKTMMDRSRIRQTIKIEYSHTGVD